MASPKEVSVIVRAIDEVTGPVREMNTRMKGFVDGLMGIFKGLGAGLAALGLFDFFKDSVKVAGEATESWARLGVAVDNAGGDFAAIRPQLDAAIVATQRMTTATGTELRDALTTMITMTSDVTGSLKNMGLAADVAAYKHIGVADAAELVGKAMMGNAKVLRQFGIEGGTAGERMAVFAQVMKGFSEEHLNSFPGQLELVSRGWHDVKEATGEAILATDAVGASTNRVAGALSGVHSFIKENEEGISGLTTAVGALGSALGFVAHVVGVLFVGALDLGTSIMVTFIGGIKEIPDGIRLAFGELLVTIGATGVALKGLLKKVGIDLGDGLAENMAASGAKMVQTAHNNMDAIDDVIKQSWRDLGKVTADGGQAVADATAVGHTKVIRLTKDQAAALLAITEDGYESLTAAQKDTLRALQAEHKSHGVAIFRMTSEQNKALDAFNKAAHAETVRGEKEFTKTVEEIEKYSHATVLTLLEGHYKTYMDATAAFWGKLEALDKAANASRATNTDAYKQALKELGDAQDAITRKFADAILPAVKLENTYSTLPPTMTRVKVSTELISGAELEQIAHGNDLRLSIQNIADETVQWAGKALALADALGISDDNMRASFASIQAIAAGIHGVNDAIKSLSGPTSIGAGISGVLGVIGAAVGIVKGIGGVLKSVFGGESESAKKIRLALESNAQHIDKLIDSIGDLNINLTGKQLAGTQSALKEFFAGGGANTKGWGDKLGTLLLKQGVTMDDLEAVAKTLQIDISPDGHLSPQALAQLGKALAAIEPTQFANTYKGDRDRLKAETDLLDLSPEEQAKRLGAIGGSRLSGGTAAAIGGLDFSTVTGRTSALSTIQGLFANLKNIPTAELGGLQPAEFLQLLEDLKGLIDTANQASTIDAGTTDTGTTLPEGPTTNPEPSSGLGVAGTPGPGDTATPPIDYLASIASTLSDFVPLEQDSFAHLLDVQVSALDRLTSIDAVLALMAAPDGAAGSPKPGNITITIGDVTVQTQATDAQGVSRDFAQQLDRQLRLILQDQLRARGSVVLTT